MNNPLLTRVKKCTLCAKELPLEPKPVLQFSEESLITIIGQAPGSKAHDTNTPWNDPSGERLRAWLGLSNSDFYNSQKVALIPMGFCYPGRGKSGDLPPDKRCAPKWHHQIFQSMKKVKLTLLIGSYAQNYYLEDKKTLTERCQDWQTYLPEYAILPHPSPRNNIWLKRNKWFEEEVVPSLREHVQSILSN